MSLAHTVLAASSSGNPAGGAAIGQIVLATAIASIATAILMLGIMGYRNHPGRDGRLRRMAAFSEKVTGLPSWTALPLGIGGGSLLIALLGMYWDISLHIDQGRDPGPLANPAHYLILVGLYGVFASGCLALALPEEKPGPAAIRITRDWYVPVGGVLTAACGGFALLGFPLDDMWHRLFGQDVTLWGPTHLMLFGGAGLTLIGQAILLAEGLRFRGLPTDRINGSPFMTAARRVGLMGGLLIGLSTFQGEFDFGVPQFRMVFQPMLIAFAAGLALTAARLWIGKGGALAAAAMFLLVRGGISLIVGVPMGEAMPSLPFYLVEALCVEAVALAVSRDRPLALGAIGGLACGTIGFASEWVWVDQVFRLKWNDGIMPEALICAAIAGVAGGLLGGLLGAGLRFRLPKQAVARPVAIGAFLAVAALTAYGLSTTPPDGQTATFALQTAANSKPGERYVTGTVRLSPSSAGRGAAWVSLTSWQNGKLKVDRLKPLGDGVYALRTPAPAYGDWKTMLRVQNGRTIMGVPMYMPEDKAIPVAGVPALDNVTRAFVADRKLMQRERRDDIPGWLWNAACILILVLAVVFISALSWGVARVARTGPRGDDGTTPPAEPTPSSSKADRARRFTSTPRVAGAPGT